MEMPTSIELCEKWKTFHFCCIYISATSDSSDIWMERAGRDFVCRLTSPL